MLLHHTPSAILAAPGIPLRPGLTQAGPSAGCGWVNVHAVHLQVECLRWAAVQVSWHRFERDLFETRLVILGMYCNIAGRGGSIGDHIGLPPKKKPIPAWPPAGGIQLLLAGEVEEAQPTCLEFPRYQCQKFAVDSLNKCPQFG